MGAGSAADAARYLDKIHAAFPSKPVVISEYGYCACTEDRPEGDEHRVEILRTHDLAIRSREYTAGAIFSATTTTAHTRVIAARSPQPKRARSRRRLWHEKAVV